MQAHRVTTGPRPPGRHPRRAVVELFAVALSVLVACSGPSAEQPEGGRPPSAAQCLDDDAPRNQGYPVRLAVPERDHSFRADRVVLDVCLPAPGGSSAQLAFRLIDLEGTRTPMQTTIERTDRPHHMSTAVAALRGGTGSGRIAVTLTFDGVSQGDAVVVDLADGRARVRED